MGTVVMYSTVSVDGFVADEHDQPGPLFDWLTSGDVPLDESGVLKVSQTSYDYTRPYWDQIGATIVGRHVFDLTDGWDGTPPGGVDHVVGRDPPHRSPRAGTPRRRFTSSTASRQPWPRRRSLRVTAWSRSPPARSVARCLPQVWSTRSRMDVVPVVLGSGKRYFGSVDAQHLLEDPDVVLQGNRVLHLRYRVRRRPS